MVLRKQAPPRLENSAHGYGRSDTITQATTSPTATASFASSPKRLTRPGRARSSPRFPRFLLQHSVYSSDLNTSPAFDLMPIEEAQKSPASSSLTDSHQDNPWEDELVERPDSDSQEYLNVKTSASPLESAEDQTRAEGRTAPRVPSIVVAGTQRRMAANEWQSTSATDHASIWEQQPEPPAVQLQSNNPFLKAKPSEANPWESNVDGSSQGQASRGVREDDRLSQGASFSLYRGENSGITNRISR